MLDYGRGGGAGSGVTAAGYQFSAMPKVVQQKPKYKDPYGGAQEEYYPQNIMQDRRVARGSTYASMVIPAGTNPDTMIMERKQEKKKRRTKRPAAIATQEKEIYPNREIPTPEPVPGRLHMEIQTEKFLEQLTDKPPDEEKGIATEFYLDRPPVPLF